ncbi:hypothetical protein OROMI_024086 [Orobanche minor]
MAATTSRSPNPPLISQIRNPNFNRNPFFSLKPNKRRRSIHFIACSSGNSNNDNTRAIELQKLMQDSPYEFNTKESPPSLPRTAFDLSNLASEGSRLRVAYQGVRGAYSESAAEKAYPNCEAVPCEQFDTAFEAVERWLVDRAVLPIENSLGGSIHRNYDLLLRHRLHIVGEVKLAIRHCLLANPGIKIENLTRVLSHPQALAQCENTLTKLGLVREAVDDTAGAAKHVAFHKLNDAGAVASFTAAEIYGLDVLAQDIQDDSDNVTRFLMLAREPIIPGTHKPFKTSIVYSLEEGPGMLFKALAVFAMRNINLMKIESRPLQKRALQSSDDSAIGFPKRFWNMTSGKGYNLHTKKRNRLHTKTLNKLVFVMYNKRLKSRWLKKTSLKEDEDPLALNEIPSDDEWMVDENGSNNYGSVLTDNIGDELVEVGDGDNEHVREVNEDGGRGRVGGRTRGRGIGRGRGRGRGKRKRDALDKGKRLQLLDEEDEIEFIESDDHQEDDSTVELFDDDDDGGGNTSGFDPYFPYLFYVDFEASMADERAQNALRHLKEFATFMRVLGSYPADNGLP